MSEYTINYSLYIYIDGTLRSYPGGRTRMKFATVREAIEYVQDRIAKMKRITKPKFCETYAKQQILISEHTGPWMSRIRGVLTDEGKCYTEIPPLINPEVSQTK